MLVLERESEFRDRVRGEGMHPWGVAEAKELGIYDRLARVGNQTRFITLAVSPFPSPPRDLVETSPFGVGSLNFLHPEMQEQVNDWISDVVLYVVGHYREEISAVISETIKRWDAEATSQRIEIQVGRDLQFIRINGTLVGGMVGLLIHTVIQLLA